MNLFDAWCRPEPPQVKLPPPGIARVTDELYRMVKRGKRASMAVDLSLLKPGSEDRLIGTLNSLQIDHPSLSWKKNLSVTDSNLNAILIISYSP